MPSSEVSPELAYDYSLFEGCNATELYQIARDAGFVVMPNLPRETLIRVIISDIPAPDLEEHPIDAWRRAIMLFIIDHRKRLETQLSCPAKSFQPDACFSCIDTQVVSCLAAAEPNRHLIQLHLRKTTHG